MAISTKIISNKWSSHNFVKVLYPAVKSMLHKTVSREQNYIKYAVKNDLMNITVNRIYEINPKCLSKNLRTHIL